MPKPCSSDFPNEETHMVRRVLCSLVPALLAAGPCGAQTSYNGVIPGRSTLAQVAAILGQPTRSGSNVAEYRHPESLSSISVSDRPTSGAVLVEKVQLVFLFPALRAPLAEHFGLPQRAEASSRDSAGRLVEYYGAPKYITLRYATANADEGIVGVSML